MCRPGRGAGWWRVDFDWQCQALTKIMVGQAVSTYLGEPEPFSVESGGAVCCLEDDCVAKSFELVDCSGARFGGLQPGEVVRPGLVVEFPSAEHVPDGDEDCMFNGDEGFPGSTSRSKSRALRGPTGDNGRARTGPANAPLTSYRLGERRRWLADRDSGGQMKRECVTAV